MTTRNFNYTGRILIPQECIDGRLIKMASGPPGLEIDFDWVQAKKLATIPDDANIFVDVNVDMSFMRFNYGLFSNPIIPENILLKDLDSYTSATFVVRVVKNGELLAASKKHTVTLALPDTKSRRSMIIPEYRDLGERPWMLEVHETIEYPKLVFNDKWWNESLNTGWPLDKNMMVMGSIMPSVLEGMLHWLLIHQKHDMHRWYDDPTWRGSWIRFAITLSGTHPPKTNDFGEYESMDILENWISSVVLEFSESRSLTTALVSMYGGE